jgi:hypothetical protein
MRVVQIEKGMGAELEMKKKFWGMEGPNKGEKEKREGAGNKLKIHICTVQLQKTNKWCVTSILVRHTRN